MPEHKFTLASRYIESLRHAGKKQYARDYYQFLRAEGQSPEPNRPETLSVMGAQAVRMSILECFGYQPGCGPDWC